MRLSLRHRLGILWVLAGMWAIFALNHSLPVAPSLLPPTAVVLGFEPAGISSEQGQDLWLLSLEVRNPNPPGPSPFAWPTLRPHDSLYFESLPWMVQVRAGDRVLTTSNINNQISGVAALGPLGRAEFHYLVPSDASRCDFRVRFAGPSRLLLAAWTAGTRLEEGRRTGAVSPALTAWYWRLVSPVRNLAARPWRSVDWGLPVSPTPTDK